jgi:hypothetical protein
MDNPPAETVYGDIELDLIENEPPNTFPTDQSSYWGTLRKVFADLLQAEIADRLGNWYLNLDPRTVNADDIAEWEQMYGLPAPGVSTLDARRAAVSSRRMISAFTRPRRNAIIESFILVPGGSSTSLTPTGIDLPVGGVTLYGEDVPPAAAYAVYEDITNFSYLVNIDETVGVNVAGLTRELARITPAGITFTIDEVAVP